MLKYSVEVHRRLTFHSHGSAGAPWTSNSISWWRSSAYAWRVWYLAAASHRTPAGPPSCSPVHTPFRTSWSYVQNNTNIELTATESLHGTWRQAHTRRSSAVKRSATKTELSAAQSNLYFIIYLSSSFPVQSPINGSGCMFEYWQPMYINPLFRSCFFYFETCFIMKIASIPFIWLPARWRDHSPDAEAIAARCALIAAVHDTSCLVWTTQSVAKTESLPVRSYLQLFAAHAHLFFKVVQRGWVLLQFIVSVELSFLCAQNVAIKQKLPHEFRSVKCVKLCLWSKSVHMFHIYFSFIPVVGPEVAVAGKWCLVFSDLKRKTIVRVGKSDMMALSMEQMLALATAMRALERMVWHNSDKSPISLMLLYKWKQRRASLDNHSCPAVCLCICKVRTAPGSCPAACVLPGGEWRTPCAWYWQPFYP